MTSDVSDFSWLAEHSQELNEKYKNKWIAILNQQIIAVADTATEADTLARSKCPEQTYLLDHMGELVDLLYAGV